jgi:hypothetical protein
VEAAETEPAAEPEEARTDDIEAEPAPNVVGLTPGAVACLLEQPAPEPLPHGFTASDVR